MMKLRILVMCVALLALSAGAWAVTTYTWEMDPTFADYSVPISSSDLIQGQIGTIEAGGFHGAFPELNGSQLTDGILGSGTDSVLQDYGSPSLRISYTFPEQQIQEIRSFGGNLGLDGRVFQDLDVEVQYQGDWYEILHEATTGPYYVSNNGNEASLIRISEQGGGPLAEGLPVTGVRLSYWCVNNTQNWFQPRDAGNTVGASIIKEIDVLPVPEPSSVVALATGLVGMAGLFIKRRPY